MTMACYICNRDAHRSRVVEGYNIYTCSSCGLFWVPGVSTEEVAAYYSEEYFNNPASKSGYQDYLAEESLHRRNASTILMAAGNYLVPGTQQKVLDVGCAYGFLLDEARKLGFEVYGVELSDAGTRYARDSLHLDIKMGTLAEAEYSDDSFDAVFIIGTIEHLIDPADELREVHRVLKSGGILVITTIDTKGLLPLFSWKPPEHLFYFSSSNLSLLLEELSFDTLDTRMHYVHYHLHDLFHRFAHFSSIFLFDKLGKLIERMGLQAVTIRMPTNEMLVIARKTTARA